jgi:hypothetical protein
LKEYCGSAAQWAQFDSSTAPTVVSCRNTGTAKAMCLFAKQWEYLDQRSLAAVAGSGFPKPDVTYPTYQTFVTMRRTSDLSHGYTMPVTGP